MALHMLYPAIAILTLFVLLVIILMLRYGMQLCGLRHTAYECEILDEDAAFEQKVSYA